MPTEHPRSIDEAFDPQFQRALGHDVPDPVNHPAHYTAYEGLEVIQITEQLNFCLGNAVKYILRAEHKENFEQDIDKAIWYLQREKARRASKGKHA